MRRKLLILILGVCVGGVFMTLRSINDLEPETIKQGAKIISLDHVNNKVTANLSHERKMSSIPSTQITELEKANYSKLSTASLREEIRMGREKIDNERLIERLNKGEIPDHEIKVINELFEKMALISLESGKRKMEELLPDFERGLARIDERLKKIRGIIGSH